MFDVTVQVTLTVPADTPAEAMLEAKDYLHRRLMPLLQTEIEPYTRLDWEHAKVSATGEGA